jgi:ANTAR domain
LSGDALSGDPKPGADTSELVVRRCERGWQVGGEQAADLTSAMVLADLLAAELGVPGFPGSTGSPGSSGSSGPPRAQPASEVDEAARLAVTVAQLEHALTARVRVEQAIGVLAERHRLRPRQAFDLLRKVARSGGRRVIEIAENVVDSASNPLLPLPEELARKPAPPGKRSRSPRPARAAG